MKVVFFEEVEGTAQVGEIKEVKNGFARNYLLPRGLAGAPTTNNLARAERLAKADAIRQAKLDGDAAPLAAAIDGGEFIFRARVGEQGRLFGSVTARDIAERLSERAGATIEHRQVQLAQALRQLGTEQVRVRLTRNVFANVSVVVEPDEESFEPTIEEVVEDLDAAETVEATTEEPAAGAVAEQSQPAAVEA